MAHLLTDDEILAAMAVGSEDLRRNEVEAANKPAIYEHTYRDLMAINGDLAIPNGTDSSQSKTEENLSMVNHPGSQKGEKRR